MMRHTLLILSIASVLLAGCAPATMQGLRDEHAGRVDFEVDMGYQALYRRIVGNMRGCFQSGGLLGPEIVVQSDLYTDTKRGEITLAIIGLLGSRNPIVTDVVSVGEARTKVTSYYWLSTWEGTARAIEQWVKNGSTACSV